MTKRKLLLVVGAGASVEFGMPSVADVGDILRAEAQKWCPLADNPATNLYVHLEGEVCRYWNSDVKPFLRRDPQFEDILYTIFVLTAAYPAGANTSALGALLTVNKLPDFIYSGKERKSANQDDLHFLGCILVDSLLRDFRERCRWIENTKTGEFRRLAVLMTALHEEFEIAVVSLNYDNIIYRSLPGIEVGFDPRTGRFEQNRIFGRENWPCMLHLHGSVHFDMQHDARLGRRTDLHEIHWKRDIAATFNQNALGRSTDANPEGSDFPTSAIVAGYGKATQLLRRPFRTYFSELDRLVSNCDALLFAGYGFGDKHLNIAFEGFRDSRHRPVVTIGRAEDDAMTVRGVGWGERNTCIPEILDTFDTDRHSMRWLGHSVASTVKELKRAKEFEYSAEPNTPLALWYNGMLAACDDPDKILARLRQS